MPTDAASHLGYFAVLLGTFLEGETVLLLAGLAAQHGYLSFPAVVGLAVVGGFLGDQVYFFIGRRYGKRLLARYPSLAARAPRVHALIERWDMYAIILFRFLYGVRIAGPIVIGTSDIPYRRLAFFNLIGALLWAPLVAGLGYFAGQAVQEFFGRIPHPGVVAVMGVLLAATLIWLAFEWRRRRMR